MKNVIKKKIIENFKALVINKVKNKYSFGIEKIKLIGLKKNEVLIKIFYSSINYKDILMCAGNPGLANKYPHVPGIDCSGKVVSSNSKKFKIGNEVMIIARPIGVKTFGSLAEYIVAPSKWIEKIPKKMNLKSVVIFGTAGFTSMLGLNEMTKNKPNKNYPILISGATGGVGLLSIFAFSKFGFKVCALTGKLKNQKILRKVGANEIIDIKELNNFPDMPLLKMRFGGIVDSIGGDVIYFGSRQLINNSAIISIGNASAQTTQLNIMPFILRGVKILGINAETTPQNLRKKIWKQIAILSKDKRLSLVYKECSLKESINKIKKIKARNHVGRFIVKI